MVPLSFGIENWLFTGAANPLDITGGRRTVVWERKTPDHRGMILTGNALAEMGDDDIVLERSGPGLDMKIQAKDCANGGIFQMEVERGDGTTTRFTHVLKPGVFYFDNPNFRAREGDKVQFDAGQDGIDVQTLTIAPRINVANTLSAKFVGRDSPQVATRLQEVKLLQSDPQAGRRHLRRRSTLRPRLTLGCGERRPDGMGDRRGRDRSGAPGLQLRPAVPSAKSRARRRGRAGLPVPGAAEPTAAAADAVPLNWPLPTTAPLASAQCRRQNRHVAVVLVVQAVRNANLIGEG